MKTLRALSLIAAALALVACGNGRQWRTHDITGFMPPLAFHLTGENGQPTTARDFRGHTVLLYFGYTHCPDVCPLTLAALARALHDIGPSADQVRVLFVSVDPERDTPPLLARYTEAFGPRFVGLTGTRQQLDALAKRYRVSYRYGARDAEGNYPVFHSSGIFVFDRQGGARLLMREQDGVAAIAHDLDQLVGSQDSSSSDN